MPANKKYLSSGPVQALRFILSFLGGLLITSSVFAFLALVLPDHKVIVVTTVYAFFPVWLVLMFVPYLIQNIRRVTLLYSALIVLFFTLTLFFK